MSCPRPAMLCRLGRPRCPAGHCISDRLRARSVAAAATVPLQRSWSDHDRHGRASERGAGRRRRSEHRARPRRVEIGAQPARRRRPRQRRHRTRLPGPQPDRPDPPRRGRRDPRAARRRERQRQRVSEDRRAHRAARREAAAWRQEHHRGCLGQGRGRQEHHRGQPRAGAGRRGRAGRHARCRHLRPLAAADARHLGQARERRRQDARADGRPRHPGELDRLPDRHRHADGLARPDGHAGAGAAAARDELARPRLPDRRHAARHRRHPPDAVAEDPGDRRGDRHHAAGHRAARRPQGAEDVREGGHPDPRHRREHGDPRLHELRPRRAHLRCRRRRADGEGLRRRVPRRSAAGHPDPRADRLGQPDGRRRAG